MSSREVNQRYYAKHRATLKALASARYYANRARILAARKRARVARRILDSLGAT